MNDIYDEENNEQLTICLSEIFTENELSLITGSLNAFLPKLRNIENKRTYHTSMAEDNLQKLIDKIEDAS